MGESGKKIIEPDPDFAPVVRQMFEWYATGRHSVREITRMAPRRGPSRFVRPANPCRRAACRRCSGTGPTWANLSGTGEPTREAHEPIVSRDLWKKVQDVLDGRRVNPNRKPKRDFAFTGLVRCGHCGCSMVAEIKKGRYVYYHCSRAKGKCPEPYTREELLEERFAELLDRLRFDDEVPRVGVTGAAG